MAKLRRTAVIARFAPVFRAPNALHLHVHFSYIERCEEEIGTDVSLKIRQESGKSIEWLLTGEDSLTFSE